MAENDTFDEGKHLDEVRDSNDALERTGGTHFSDPLPFLAWTVRGYVGLTGLLVRYLRGHRDAPESWLGELARAHQLLGEELKRGQ